MSNPSGPDEHEQPTDDGDAPVAEDGTETEIIPSAETTPAAEPSEPTEDAEPERRFTAPSGFDGSTQVIETAPEPATEIFAVPGATEPIAAANSAAPQLIPGRSESPKQPTSRRSWGWVLAVVLVIAAIVAVAILGTVLLTRDKTPPVSQEDLVRNTIQSFDTAIKKGDLSTLRSITCGETADAYIKYDDKRWNDIHARVAAARQYPVVASIDQVVVNEKHAEANVTTFMAFDPSTQSSRSFDLEYRDDQWKICQAPR